MSASITFVETIILGQARHLLPIQEYVGGMGAAEDCFSMLHFVSLLQLLYESSISNKLRHGIFSSRLSRERKIGSAETGEVSFDV